MCWPRSKYWFSSHLPYLTGEHRPQRVKEKGKHVGMCAHRYTCFLSELVWNKNLSFFSKFNSYLNSHKLPINKDHHLVAPARLLHSNKGHWHSKIPVCFQNARKHWSFSFLSLGFQPPTFLSFCTWFLLVYNSKLSQKHLFAITVILTFTINSTLSPF